ncbi:hypothetical protein HZA44_04445 [Candidatus Peregrinibacteria bacterium]|nr:hypothetical protein [Candidatus Peregrinibacteria bacterium]
MKRLIAFCAVALAASSAWAEEAQDKGLLEMGKDLALEQAKQSTWAYIKEEYLTPLTDFLTQLYPSPNYLLGGWIAWMVVFLLVWNKTRKTRWWLALLSGWAVGTALRQLDVEWIGWPMLVGAVALAITKAEFRPEVVHWLLAKWHPASTEAEPNRANPHLPPQTHAAQTHSTPAPINLERCPKCGKESLGEVFCTEGCGYKRGSGNPPPPPRAETSSVKRNRLARKV